MYRPGELTKSELRAVRRAVVEQCGNYDALEGCLPLNADCYMLGLAYRDSPLCRYFRDVVLPERKDLQGVFSREHNINQGGLYDLSE